MKKYLYILLSTFGLFYMPSCKKENQRIGENTYELDSVAIGYLDTTGNYYYKSHHLSFLLFFDYYSKKL